MTRRWAYIIIFTVVVLVIWSGWGIYNVLKKDQEVEEYSRYVLPIEETLDEELLNKISNSEERILVKEEEITPPQ